LVPIREVCTPVDALLCAIAGPVDQTLLVELERRGFDQAPVLAERSRQFIGIVEFPRLRDLMSRGEALLEDDPEVCSERNFLRIGATGLNLFRLLDALRGARAVLVVSESSATELGHHECLEGLITLSDLNRVEIRSLVYSILSSSEMILSRALKSAVPDPWDWLPHLTRERQASILGYWELSKRSGVDIGPFPAATLSDLLTILEVSPRLRSVRPSRGKDLKALHHKVLGVRNRVMHPVRPLVAESGEVDEVYQALRYLETIQACILEATPHPPEANPSAADENGRGM